MKLLVLADDDLIAREISGISPNVLISCGDLADETITAVAQKLNSPPILAVRGNHDRSDPFAAPIIDLHLKAHVINGVRFGGFQGCWKYKPRGNYLYEQKEVDRLLSRFPPVDVFIAHNSPRHVHERDDDVHVGFDAFVAYIERARPRLFIHGHQHLNRETRLGDTRVIGVYGFKWIET